jgi:hypothetical protein
VEEVISEIKKPKFSLAKREHVMSQKLEFDFSCIVRRKNV